MEEQEDESNPEGQPAYIWKYCEKVNCNALYDAIVATIKLIYDILFCCCKKKD
jgi:hypothetical protein